MHLNFHLFADDYNLFYFHLFADDYNLFYFHGDLHHLEQTVNQELDKINAWFCANTLSRNIDKTP